jgi:hypothetical protein
MKTYDHQRLPVTSLYYSLFHREWYVALKSSPVKKLQFDYTLSKGNLTNKYKNKIEYTYMVVLL